MSGMVDDLLPTLVTLREALERLSSAEGDPREALDLALKDLVRMAGADAGAVAVPSSDGDAHVVARWHLGRTGPLCRTVLRSVLAASTAEATVIEPPASGSALDAAITSILGAPVRRLSRTIAAVYLDRRDAEKPPFAERERLLASSFGSAVALAADLLARLADAEDRRALAEARADDAASAVAASRGVFSLGSISTRSPAMMACLDTAHRVARFEADILLLGETGTGKEHLARCIHASSRRASGPFVAVNCAAVPEALFESELFGHERGAFTGADRKVRGRIELSAGGTLFLDEVGDLPLPLQAKLLRVLEDKRVRPVGGTEERLVDVRIMAATHRRLETEVDSGRFRQDLYYRLNGVPLSIPPLRDRMEDLPDLAHLLLRASADQLGRSDLSLLPAALRRLARHGFPGNVRELKNVLRRLAVLADGPAITASDVERALAVTPDLPAAGEPAPAPAAVRRTGTLRQRVQEAERAIIQEALAESGSVAAAARMLGVRRQSLHERCLRLGLRLP